ncbi:MAG: NADH-quinone oxidoreductase subunit A [Acidobacteriota bacterium]
MSQPLASLAIYALCVVAIVTAILMLSALAGPRHRSARRDLPFESGMPTTREAPLRVPVAFYLVAIAFLIFDLEAAFLFTWAVAARESGWSGYVEVVVFTLVLLVGLVYLWAKGALDWGAAPAGHGPGKGPRG